MRPPVEHVRVSAKGKDILIKIKRNTGLEHWNEICRIALCRSLANPTPPTKFDKPGDNAIDIEWKTFAGQYHNELATLLILRARADNINTSSKELLSGYLRNHIERGILSLQNTKSLQSLWL